MCIVFTLLVLVGTCWNNCHLWGTRGVWSLVPLGSSCGVGTVGGCKMINLHHIQYCDDCHYNDDQHAHYDQMGNVGKKKLVSCSSPWQLKTGREVDKEAGQAGGLLLGKSSWWSPSCWWAPLLLLHQCWSFPLVQFSTRVAGRSRRALVTANWNWKLKITRMTQLRVGFIKIKDDDGGHQVSQDYDQIILLANCLLE